MQTVTLNLLIVYVISLIQNDDVDAVHVTNLIPKYSIGMDKRWTQFPKLDEAQLKRLDQCGVVYDQPSGWFRRKER